MTQILLTFLIKTFGISHYSLSDGTNAKKWIGQRCFDCSGLIVWCLQQLGLIPTNADYTAATLYSKMCTPVKVKEIEPGDLLFIRDGNNVINHVGIYAGNYKTIEAINTKRGVVEGDSRRFNVYGRLKLNLEEEENIMLTKILNDICASAENAADWKKELLKLVEDSDNGKVAGILKYLPLLLEHAYNYNK